MLPKSIEEIKRLKMKPEGVKEGEFLIGTRFMMDYMNNYALRPFLAKSTTVY